MYGDILANGRDDELLDRRGWVLQELLLSPRIIAFGNKLTWK
jgi:hypothetical protein